MALSTLLSFYFFLHNKHYVKRSNKFQTSVLSKQNAIDNTGSMIWGWQVFFSECIVS